MRTGGPAGARGAVPFGVRHTARRRLRRAGCEGAGVGIAGAGCDGAARAADAVSVASHLRRQSVVVGCGHGCGQRTRRDGG